MGTPIPPKDANTPALPPVVAPAVTPSEEELPSASSSSPVIAPAAEEVPSVTAYSPLPPTPTNTPPLSVAGSPVAAARDGIDVVPPTPANTPPRSAVGFPLAGMRGGFAAALNTASPAAHSPPRPSAGALLENARDALHMGVGVASRKRVPGLNPSFQSHSAPEPLSPIFMAYRLEEDMRGMAIIPPEPAVPVYSPPAILCVVLTGGDCSGKGAAVKKLIDTLPALGVQPFAVPNAKHLLVQGGGSSVDASSSPHAILTLHHSALSTMMTLEDRFKKLAHRSGERAVVICDGGALDLRVSMDEEDFAEMLQARGISGVAELNKRYDLVIHMVTVVSDGECEGKEERGAERGADEWKTRQDGAQKDMQIRAAWADHPQYKAVRDPVSMSGRIQKVFNLIAEVVGVETEVGLGAGDNSGAGPSSGADCDEKDYSRLAHFSSKVTDEGESSGGAPKNQK